MPETARKIVPLSRICRGFRGENKVDIVGVTGSIPVTPTILFKYLDPICEVLSRFIKPGRASA